MVIGCFHMSGLLVRRYDAAGPDGNPPTRSLIKLARSRGALNQDGLFSPLARPLHIIDCLCHFVDRRSSSGDGAVGSVGFAFRQHRPGDPRELVGERD